jgi:hypothetical protein
MKDLGLCWEILLESRAFYFREIRHQISPIRHLLL